MLERVASLGAILKMQRQSLLTLKLDGAVALSGTRPIVISVELTV